MVLRNLVTTPAQWLSVGLARLLTQMDENLESHIAQDYCNNLGQAPLYFVFQHVSSSPSLPRLNTCLGSQKTRPNLCLATSAVYTTITQNRRLST
jgi:hypothetical protein